jgi:hypothetical protein
VKALLVLFLLVCSGVGLVAQRSCMQNAYSYWQQDICVCTGRTDYPGGCRSQLESGSSCTIMSYYACGRNGSETCEIAYTETTGPTCGPDGAKAAPEWFSPDRPTNVFALWLRNQLYSSPRESQAQCAITAEEFRSWLEREIKLQSMRTRG